jgi:hypothetical protein
MTGPHRTHRAPPLAWITTTGGILIVLFWTLWFTGAVELGQDDPRRRSFEAAFPVADAVLAATLVTTGVLFARGRRAAAAFGLVAAAAQTLFLGLLDATFHAVHGYYWPLTADAASAIAINALCIGGGLLGMRAGWRRWGPA